MFSNSLFLFSHHKVKKKSLEMKLKEHVIQKLNTVENRVALALALKVSESAIIKQIGENNEDGVLTKYSTLQKIAKLVGEKKVESIIEPTKEVA